MITIEEMKTKERNEKIIELRQVLEIHAKNAGLDDITIDGDMLTVVQDQTESKGKMPEMVFFAEAIPHLIALLDCVQMWIGLQTAKPLTQD